MYRYSVEVTLSNHNKVKGCLYVNVMNYHAVLGKSISKLEKGRLVSMI